jgi:hypothetical protein
MSERGEPMAQLVLPRVLAMVMCDDVVEADDEIGVFNLTGVRTAVEASSFPAVHSLRIFVQMSGHKGEASCYVVIEDSESHEIIDKTALQAIDFENPILVVPVVFEFLHCVFPQPGVYYVEIYEESKLIGERRLTFRIEE